MEMGTQGTDEMADDRDVVEPKIRLTIVEQPSTETCLIAVKQEGIPPKYVRLPRYGKQTIDAGI